MAHHPGKSARFVLGIILLLATVASAENYAVLFSGGWDKYNNWERYYDNTLRMWNVLTDTLFYKPENIWVVFADGTNPGLDQHIDGGGYVNSDWTDVVNAGSTVLTATAANLQTTMANLPAGPEDLAVLWTFDHGGGICHDPGESCYDADAPNIYGEETLTGWGETIRDDQLDTWVNDWDDTKVIGRQAYVFGQCFAGGMLDDLLTLSSRQFGCAATNHYEFSYGDYFVAAFSDAIEDQGYTRTHDLYQWAYDHDSAATGGEGPGGTYVSGVEHPWKRGEDLDIAVAKWKGLGAGGTYHWWSTPENWEFQPNADRTVRIEFTGSGDVLVQSADCYGGYVTLDYSAGVGANGYMNIVTGGHLHSKYQIVGENRYGRVLQTGGNNTVTYNVTLGRRSGSQGVYDISGGTLTAANLYVGRGGTGTVNHSGGTVTLSNTLRMGEEPTGVGHYNLSGTGSLTANYEYVGYDGTATFTQTGGTNTATYYVYVGRQSGSDGTYNLSGGNLNAQQLRVGYYGSGEVAHSAGSAALSSSLTLGYYSGSDGSYNLSGTGTLAADSEYVGDYGEGSFTQTGGSNTIGSYLYVGRQSSGEGTYSLGGGGSLSAVSEYVGEYGEGSFTQTGGTNTASNYLIMGNEAGGTGTYVLSAGTLTVMHGRVGQRGSGWFVQSGGTHYVTGNLYVGAQAGSTGKYTISGGTLDARDTHISVGLGGTSTFALNGGTVIADTFYLQSYGTFTSSGLTGVLRVNALSGFSTSFAGSLHIGHSGGAGAGSHSVAYGQSLNVGNDLVIGYDAAGSFVQAGGYNTVSVGDHLDLGYLSGGSGTYDLGGANAALSAYYEMIGRYGSGSFTQSNGTNTVAQQLYVGTYAGSAGSYALSGGQVNAPIEQIGTYGTGTFNQTGGTNDVSGTLYVGSWHDSTGVYGLGGSGQLSANQEWIGVYGDGTFTHSAGTNTVTGNLYVGYYNVGSGTYELSGSGQLSTADQYIGREGTGTFNHSGGTNTLNSVLYLGHDSTGDGTYNLGGTGQISASHEYVGRYGTGTFNQTAGTNTTGYVYLGRYGGGSGTYNLSGGSMSAITICVGSEGVGQFNWTGGALDADYVFVRPYSTLDVDLDWTFDGQLNVEGGLADVHLNELTLDGADAGADISGGTLSVRNEVIAAGAKGTVTQTAGTHTVNQTIWMGQTAGSQGAYALGGGTLSATRTLVGFHGTAAFTQTGGTFTTPEYLILGRYTDGVGTYELSDGTLTTGVLHVGYDGTGQFDWTGGGLNVDTVHVPAGGTMNVTHDWAFGGELYVSGGTVDLGGYSLVLDTPGKASAIATITAGSLASSYQYVGYYTDGAIVHSGGTNTITNSLLVGYQSGGEGTYQLSGTGELGANVEIMGCYGSGRFTQSGGTNTVNNSLHLGYGAAGTGTYEMSAGSVSSPWGYVGYQGTGSFTQSGGTATFGNLLVLGSQTGSAGTYSISGGQLEAGELRIGGQGVGTFKITNSGADVTVSNLLRFGANGYFSAVSGSTIHMTGSALENQSTTSGNLKGLGVVTLVFEGGTSYDPFEVAGQDEGAVVSGWTDNFALDTLQLGGADYGRIELLDDFDNQPRWVGREALYVQDLILNCGAAIQLNNLNLYYRNGGAPKRFFEGDANLDGAVNFLDLGVLATHYDEKYTCWPDGDFNGDRVVNFLDLGILATNYDRVTGGAPPVPEPAAMALLAAGALALLRRRRRS